MRVLSGSGCAPATLCASLKSEALNNVLVYLPVCCDKMLWKTRQNKALEEEGVFLSSQFKVQPVMVGKPGQQKPKAVDHTVPTGKEAANTVCART